MGLFSWFRSSEKPDYESVLSRLANEVQDAKIHLSEIRLRERRTSLLINAYGLALWAVWVGLWWVGGLPFGLVGWDTHGIEARAAGVGGILAGPVFIWALNNLVRIYFTRQRNVEETHLRKLLAEQKKQVEEIKKATNYDSTRKLIEQYDMQNGQGAPGLMHTPMMTPTKAGTPQRRQPSTPSPSPAGKGRQNQQGTPRAPGHLVGVGGTPMMAGPGSRIPIPEGMTPEQAALLQMQQMQAVQPVLPTPEKRWYDRVVDSILGDDPSQAPQSKYALVCGECFRHNGLVGSKYEWERMQWICPRCNHMNPPPISRPKSPTASQPPIQPAAPAPPAVNLPASSPTTPTHLSRQAASPRNRRQMGEAATPRSSRLRQEVFSASEDDDEEEGDGSGKEEKMDVDEK